MKIIYFTGEVAWKYTVGVDGIAKIVVEVEIATPSNAHTRIANKRSRKPVRNSR